MNGKSGRTPIKITQCYYPEEYTNLKDKVSENDFAIMELEEELEGMYGYLGIDTRNQNIKKEEEI